MITWEEAVQRVPAEQLDQVLAPVFDRAAVKSAKCIARGLPAGPGAATGRIYFNADRAAEAERRGEKVLLVRVETSPEDLRGMIAAEGILDGARRRQFARGPGRAPDGQGLRLRRQRVAGGLSSQDNMTVGGMTFKEGDFLSIDGTAGEVYPGEIKTAPSEIIQVLIAKTLDAKESRTYQYYAQLMKWCDKATRMNVRTNADSPDQAANAIAFGAVGIGLCRTEHMFFEGNRIDAMREMILADNLDDRKKALAKLLPYQRDDFAGIFRELKGLPATIRTLDPPLHEFLPHEAEAQKDLAAKMGVPVEKIQTAGQGTARIQPDARLARLPPGHRLSGNHRDANPRHHRSRRPGAKGRHPRQAGDHDRARRLSQGIAKPVGSCPPRRRTSAGGAEDQGQIPGRHDD